jgi:GxxExxY protein
MEQKLTEDIIGAAIQVHRKLGPGLLESAYEHCLCYELSRRSIPFQRQVELPVLYEGQKLDSSYRLDILVRDAVIVEVKAVERQLPIHSAQLLTYLRLSRYRVGMVIHFNVPVLKDGIVRMVL